jgi:oligoribonuclease
LEYLEKWTEKGKSPICGNSVGQDRKVLFREMPKFEAEWASYRTIDVSSIKELVKRWKPEILEEVRKIKKENHRAMDDILESIEELRIYREKFFNK